MPLIETSGLILLLVAALSYFLGTVPFGIVVSRIFRLADPRSIGSGNIGATNVLRSGSKVAAALAAFLGHLYPIWLGFKGGKGVATFLGTVLALSPIIGAAACLIWLVTFAIFRISSLGGIMAPALTPIAALALGHTDKAAVLAVMAVFVWWRHRENIARILNGTEPKVGQKRAQSDAPE